MAKLEGIDSHDPSDFESSWPPVADRVKAQKHHKKHGSLIIIENIAGGNIKG